MSKGRAFRIALRLLIGHMAAYGIALPWVIGAVPLAVVAAGKDLLAVDPENTSVVVRIVFRELHLPAEIAFAAAHLPCLPWSFAGDGQERLTRRIFIGGAIAVAAAGAVYAVVAWVRFWFA